MIRNTKTQVTDSARALAILTLFAGVVAFSNGQKAKAPEPRTNIDTQYRWMVAAFDEPAGFKGVWLNAGNGLADMMTTELVGRGALCLERADLAEIENEKDRGTSGLVDGNTAQATGKLLGAHWRIRVSATRFGMSGSGGGGFGGGLIRGVIGVDIRESKAEVRLDARVIDIRTGVVLGSAFGEGSNSKTSVGFGGGDLFGWLGGVSFSSNEWLESRLGKASAQAITRLTEQLAQQVPSMERKAKSLGSTVEPVAPAPAAESAPAPSGGPSSAASANESAPLSAPVAALKDLTAVVILPETILLRPNVPDPAAETEIIRQLRAAGVRVLDDQRLKQLREDRAVLAMAHGDVNGAKLEELRQMFGADILIVGEAIAERNAAQEDGMKAILSRARVEARAIQVETGEILAADGVHEPGRDLSEVLAGKNALQNGGRKLAGKLIKQMTDNYKADAPSVARITLEVGGWKRLSDAATFLKAVDAIPGVQKAVRTGFAGGTLIAQIEALPSVGKKLAETLELDAEMKRFKVEIRTETKTKIVAVTRVK